MIHLHIDVDHWVRGSLRFPQEMKEELRNRWGLSLDATYRHSQEIVHVITGRLKESGRKEIDVLPSGEVEATLVYGGISVRGRMVDYAEYEYGRGGSHDFMTPAFVATEDQYPKQMASAFENVMVRWR